MWAEPLHYTLEYNPLLIAVNQLSYHLDGFKLEIGILLFDLACVEHAPGKLPL